MGIKKFMGTWRGVVLGTTLLACFFPGIEKDCCVIRDYHWRPAVKKLFEHAVRALLCSLLEDMALSCSSAGACSNCHVVLPYRM